jgi:hypothetical protein
LLNTQRQRESHATRNRIYASRRFLPCHNPGRPQNRHFTTRFPIVDLVELRAMFSLLLLWIGALTGLFRSRGNLVLENLVLRQQLAVLKRHKLGPFEIRATRTRISGLISISNRMNQVAFLIRTQSARRHERFHGTQRRDMCSY